MRLTISTERKVTETREVDVDFPIIRRVAIGGGILVYHCMTDAGQYTEVWADFDSAGGLVESSIRTEVVGLAKGVSKILALDSEPSVGTLTPEGYDTVLRTAMLRGAAGANHATDHGDLRGLQDMVEQCLPGWGWLVRSIRSAEGEYFANVTHPDFDSNHSGKRFPRWASTPEAALGGAISDAMDWDAGQAMSDLETGADWCVGETTAGV